MALAGMEGELDYTRLGWKELVGSKLQSIMQSPTWSDTVPGSRELRELVGFRLRLRELSDSSLRQREQGVSRPGLKKFGCSRL